MTGTGRDLPTHMYAAARALILSQPSAGGAPGPVDDLQRLCRGLGAHLSVTGAAVSLMSAAGVVSASDEQCRELGELQFTLGEGPCHEAFAARRPVLIPDLAAGGARWPGYTSAALESGILAVFAFPLHVGGVGMGVLDVYAARTGSLGSDQVSMALTFAHIATEILLDEGLSPDGDGLDPGLVNALDGRAEIHQAQGMAMVALEVSLAEALALMRAHSFSRGLPLIDLARQIIAGQSPLSLEET